METKEKTSSHSALEEINSRRRLMPSKAILWAEQLALVNNRIPAICSKKNCCKRYKKTGKKKCKKCPKRK